MIIDAHTHIFPDRIAEKTITYLAGKANISPHSDGTRDGLLSRLSEAGADIALNLPVLTNPAQFDSVNRFAEELNTEFSKSKKGILSFAGIHPHCDNIDEKMAWIKAHGFLGVKIHPDYQGTFIDDERYIRILECAKENDLIVTAHSGVDGGYPGLPVRCTPERALKVIKKVNHPKFILAHLGANEMTDASVRMLCGENVYFDTAYVLRYISADDFRLILKKHGEDRILFASDSPWSSIKDDADIIRSFALPKDTEEKIFSKNAEALLGL